MHWALFLLVTVFENHSKNSHSTRIDVQTRMYIFGIYAVLDNELSEFQIFHLLGSLLPTFLPLKKAGIASKMALKY